MTLEDYPYGIDCEYIEKPGEDELLSGVDAYASLYAQDWNWLWNYLTLRLAELGNNLRVLAGSVLELYPDADSLSGVSDSALDLSLFSVTSALSVCRVKMDDVFSASSGGAVACAGVVQCVALVSAFSALESSLASLLSSVEALSGSYASLAELYNSLKASYDGISSVDWGAVADSCQDALDDLSSRVSDLGWTELNRAWRLA